MYVSKFLIQKVCLVVSKIYLQSSLTIKIPFAIPVKYSKFTSLVLFSVFGTTMWVTCFSGLLFL